MSSRLTCNIGGKVCRLIVELKSCENMVYEKDVRKLGLKIEKHSGLYRLASLKKENEVTVSKRCLEHSYLIIYIHL
jgi:hypothetical protein